MKRAVHFGAGNIGRGFLGQLYFESGYATTFVDVVPEVVAALHNRRSYPIEIVGDIRETIGVTNVDAILATDEQRVANTVASADIASTAVGVAVLEHLARPLALGLAQRYQDPAAAPLDIIVCENKLGAGPFLRERVRAQLPPEFHEALDSKTGFVEASIGRMVPVMTDAQRAADPLLVCVEPYCELPVDVNAFRGPLPGIQHLQPRHNFQAYVERKLFVHNLSHAASAYLGHLRGHTYIWQAIEDSRVRTVVEAAAGETCAALAARHQISQHELLEHAKDLLRRFQNRALGDQIARVARDPVRKLGPEDRLIGAGLLCLDQAIEPEAVALAAAAAIRYDAPNDPSSRVIQRCLKAHGLPGVLREVCRIAPESPLGTRIQHADKRLRAEHWTE